MSSPIAALIDRELRGVLEIGRHGDDGSWTAELTATQIVQLDDAHDVEDVESVVGGVAEALDLVIDHTIETEDVQRDLSLLLARVDVGGTYVVTRRLPLVHVLDLIFIAVERPDVIAAVEVDADGVTTITRGNGPPSFDPIDLDELSADPFGVNDFGVDAC